MPNVQMGASDGRKEYDREGFGRRVREGDQSEKANGRTKKGKDINPSDVRSRVRGSIAGLKRTQSPKSMMPSGEVEKRCQRSHHQMVGSGREASSGCLLRK